MSKFLHNDNNAQAIAIPQVSSKNSRADYRTSCEDDDLLSCNLSKNQMLAKKLNSK